MAERPVGEFGKRRQAATAEAAPPKRSGHVALLMMGTIAVGGGAYMAMPRANCQPGLAAPSGPQTGANCASGGSSSGGGARGYWGTSSRYSFFGGDSSSTRQSAGASSNSAQGSVTRGGFGAFAQSVSSHFSRGG